MRYLDVTTDWAFKRVFGSAESKPILKSFLNALLDHHGEHAITDLTIVDPYMVPAIEGMKDSFVDVKAVLANGNRIIVEMQVLNVPGFEQRILYNAAKELSKYGLDSSCLLGGSQARRFTADSPLLAAPK